MLALAGGLRGAPNYSGRPVARTRACWQRNPHAISPGPGAETNKTQGKRSMITSSPFDSSSRVATLRTEAGRPWLPFGFRRSTSPGSPQRAALAPSNAAHARPEMPCRPKGSKSDRSVAGSSPCALGRPPVPFSLAAQTAPRKGCGRFSGPPPAKQSDVALAAWRPTAP
jgi:hypothetical protein